MLGVIDDQDFWQCCGRQGLKRVVWIEEGEIREVQHFGAVCVTGLADQGFGSTLAALVAIAYSKTASTIDFTMASDVSKMAKFVIRFVSARGPRRLF